MTAGTTLQSAVQRYLKERRQLGFAMTAATELMRFARFADARGHKGPLTRELQLEWARQHVRRTSTVTAARRIEILRPFAAYYRQFEVNTEVLPTHALGRSHLAALVSAGEDERVGEAQNLGAGDGIAIHLGDDVGQFGGGNQRQGA